jgi:hypothetical protein
MIVTQLDFTYTQLNGGNGIFCPEYFHTSRRGRSIGHKVVHSPNLYLDLESFDLI